MNHDGYHMSRALAVARLQQGRTGKNPAVGCILIDRRGNLLAEAATADGGKIHAEELALHRLSKDETRGATAYVTLEPCGTRSTEKPSCSDRIISAGISRVVIALKDKHPLGAGGIDKMKAAGIRVEVGLMSDVAEPLYADFFSTIE